MEMAKLGCSPRTRTLELACLWMCVGQAQGSRQLTFFLTLLLYQSTAFARSFIYPAALHGRRALAGLSRGTTNPDSIFMAWLPSAGPLMRDFIYGN
jgi:hypothetical protein